LIEYLYAYSPSIPKLVGMDPSRKRIVIVLAAIGGILCLPIALFFAVTPFTQFSIEREGESDLRGLLTRKAHVTLPRVETTSEGRRVFFHFDEDDVAIDQIIRSLPLEELHPATSDADSSNCHFYVRGCEDVKSLDMDAIPFRIYRYHGRLTTDSKAVIENIVLIKYKNSAKTCIAFQYSYG